MSDLQRKNLLRELSGIDDGHYSFGGGKENKSGKEEKARGRDGTKPGPAKRKTAKALSMNELYDADFNSNGFIVDGLLGTGLYILCGDPKTGKSFFVAQLGHSVASGNEFLGRKTKQGTVILYSLEDTMDRVRDRLYKMFEDDICPDYYFSTECGKTGDTFTEDVSSFLASHKDTRLVIIDTFQKIRQAGPDYSYSGDYEVLSEIKKLADDNKICILLVHHSNKRDVKDVFGKINGTSGIMGAADGVIMLTKKTRNSDEATLNITGRDVRDTAIRIARSADTVKWEFIENESVTAPAERDEVFLKLLMLLKSCGGSKTATATEFCEMLNYFKGPDSFGYKLKIRQTLLNEIYGIEYTRLRESNKRMICFTLKDSAPPALDEMQAENAPYDTCDTCDT